MLGPEFGWYGRCEAFKNGLSRDGDFDAIQ
jgi:hypothetical protein